MKRIMTKIDIKIKQNKILRDKIKKNKPIKNDTKWNKYNQNIENQNWYKKNDRTSLNSDRFGLNPK